MRELTVRIRFTSPCLGNAKKQTGPAGNLWLPRDGQGRVVFMATWHKANMRHVSQLLGRHQDTVEKICWDVVVDGRTVSNPFYRRYYQGEDRRERYALHEAFLVGQAVSINCVVPSQIPDDDFRSLMALAGTYRGLSPFKPTEWGQYELVEVRERQRKELSVSPVAEEVKSV